MQQVALTLKGAQGDIEVSTIEVSKMGELAGDLDCYGAAFILPQTLS